MHGRPKAASGKTAHRSARSSGPDITLARYGYGASCNPLDPDQLYENFDMMEEWREILAPSAQASLFRANTSSAKSLGEALPRSHSFGFRDSAVQDAWR